MATVVEQSSASGMVQTLRAQMHHTMGGGKKDCQRHSYRDGSTEHDPVESPRSAWLLCPMPAKHPCLGFAVGSRRCGEGALGRHLSN